MAGGNSSSIAEHRSVSLVRNLNSDGTVAEPCSRRWGKLPDPDTKRERLLLWRRHLWLAIPFLGIFPFGEDSDELTNRWGHYPWWFSGTGRSRTACSIRSRCSMQTRYSRRCGSCSPLRARSLARSLGGRCQRRSGDTSSSRTTAR